MKVYFNEKEVNSEEQPVVSESSEVNWSKVSVDTKIYVRDDDKDNWLPRHFCMYREGLIYAWNDGTTSFTVDKTSNVGSVPWKYGRLG